MIEKIKGRLEELSKELVDRTELEKMFEKEVEVAQKELDHLETCLRNASWERIRFSDEITTLNKALSLLSEHE